MNPTLKNILVVIAAIIVGMFVNMGLITISSGIVPTPAGVDPNDIESINANIHLYQPKHFIFPFLAHALGTLVGAFIAAKFATSNHLRLALVIGFFFLMGGIAAVTMINGPIWFVVLDLVVAYIPMAWLGAKLAGRV